MSGWVEGREEARGGGWSDLICTTLLCLTLAWPASPRSEILNFCRSFDLERVRGRESHVIAEIAGIAGHNKNRCEPQPSWPSPGNMRPDEVISVYLWTREGPGTKTRLWRCLQQCTDQLSGRDLLWLFCSGGESVVCSSAGAVELRS